jgi:hypothetical protein
MVWLNSRWRGAYRARLHDPPPGYRPPRRRIPLKERQRMARRDWVLEHILAVILILLAASVIVIIFVTIATHL